MSQHTHAKTWREHSLDCNRHLPRNRPHTFHICRRLLWRQHPRRRRHSLIILTGPTKTQEWNFDKLLQLSTNEDETDYFISVSNRQKTSGVRFDSSTGREFNRFLGSATAAHEHGYGELLAELKKMQKEAIGAEPKLQLPSNVSPLS